MYQQRGQTTKNGCRWKYMNVLTSRQKDAQNVCNSTIVFGLIKPYIQSVRTIFFVPGKDPYIFSEFDP